MISQQRETLAHNPALESASIYMISILESTLIPITTIAVSQQELGKRAPK